MEYFDYRGLSQAIKDGDIGKDVDVTPEMMEAWVNRQFPLDTFIRSLWMDVIAREKARRANLQ